MPSMQPFRRIMPGMIDAATANELNRALELLHRLALDQEPPAVSGSEPTVPFDVPKGFWARIDGEPLADGRHPWREIVPTFPDQGGNFPTEWLDYVRSASYGGTPAYEINGASIPSGRRVFLHFAPDRQHFLFQAAALADSVPTEPPADPEPGDLYFNPITGLFFIWNGTTWITYNPDPESIDCENTCFWQFQTRCEGTSLVRYRRRVCLIYENGCPRFDPDNQTSGWVFDRELLVNVECSVAPPPETCCDEDSPLPLSLTLHLEDPSPECESLAQSEPEITLTWNSETLRWEGEASGPSNVYIQCVEGATPHFTLEFASEAGYNTAGPITADTDPPFACDPICVRWTDLALSGLCTGTISARLGNCAPASNCCPSGETLPSTLAVEFFDPTGSCGCLANVPLTFDAELGYHTGSTSACSGATAVILRCLQTESGTGFTLEMTGSCSTNGPVLETLSNPDRGCDPVCLLWETAFQVQGCCAGTVKAKVGCAPLITETCCAEEMPATLAVTVSSTGPCSGTGTLTYGPTVNWPVFFGNAPTNAWQGAVTLGEGTVMDFWLYCNPDTPGELKLGIAGCYVSNAAPAGTCSGPLNLTAVFSNGSCCGADVTSYEYTVTITAVP